MPVGPVGCTLDQIPNLRIMPLLAFTVLDEDGQKLMTESKLILPYFAYLGKGQLAL